MGYSHKRCPYSVCNVFCVFLYFFTPAPITKNIILNVSKFIGAFGTSKVVGPITIAYSEPIINPIIVYIVWLLYFSNAFFISFITNNTPAIIPIPNINKTGK